jgi:hypothetical protein
MSQTRSTRPARRRLLARPRLTRLEDRTLPAGWAFGFLGSVYHSGMDVAVDAASNVYVVGTFDSTADFDPGPSTATLTARGRSDGFLAKFDATGNFLWARRCGGEGEGDSYGSSVMGVVVDAGGNPLVTGNFRGVGSITGVDRTDRTEYMVRNGLGSSDSLGRAIVAKFGPSGDVAWVDQYGLSSTGTVARLGIAVDASGATRVTGGFSGTVDFDPGLGTAVRSGDGAFITKLNADGSFAWVSTSTGAGGGNAVGISDDGSTYVTGWFGNTITFGSVTLTSAGVGFVVKLTPAGAVVWARTGGGRALAVGRDAATGAEAVYIGRDGGFQVGEEAYVSRLTAAGDLLWTSLLAPGVGFSMDLAVDSRGHAYSICTYQSQLAVVSEFDTTGAHVRDWLRGAASRGFAGVAVGPDDSVLATGQFAGTFDTGVGILQTGGVFVVKQEQPAAPPAVTAVRVSDGSGQRSVVRSLTVTFSSVVTLDAGAFTVTRGDGTAATVAVTTATQGSRTVATLTFAGPGTEYGSLSDGNWLLRVVAARVHDAGSPTVTMVADRTEAFFRLYGDVNGDRAVNGLDLTAFRTAFGTTLGDAGYASFLDQNGDCAINGSDLTAFRTHFGMILP